MSAPSIERLTSQERGTYLRFSVAVTAMGSALGVNGSAVFQILAIENLGLSSEQIGLAVGLGAMSIPFQIVAARTPLTAAHRNLRLFVVVMGLMNLVMAGLLVGTGLSMTAVAVVVISLAVLAELAVSVLWATSFQPLLATTVDTDSHLGVDRRGRGRDGDREPERAHQRGVDRP